MAQQQSQSGQVGFKTQTAKGAYLDPGAADPNNGIFIPIRSGSIGGSRELLIPDAEIGGNRDIRTAYMGPVTYSGEFEFYPRMDSFATLLYAALGAKSSSSTGTGATLVGTHTITPSTSSTIPWLSIEEQVGDDFECFNYTDARVNTVHLEADADDYLMGSAGVLALTQSAGNTKTASPVWDTSPLFVGTAITLTLGGTALPAKSFSFDFTNNMEDDDFRLGSLTLGDVTPKRREATFSVTIRPEDSAQWRQAMYGSAVATAPQGGAVTMEQLVLTITSYEVIGSTADYYTLTLTAPKVAINPFTLEPSGDGIIETDLELQVLRPASGSELVTAVIKNHLAEVL